MCSAPIPATIVVDGKRRNLAKRIYCLTCSPWKAHNTRKIHITGKDDGGEICVTCGKNPRGHRRQCHACVYRLRWEKRQAKIYDIVGTSCWQCKYDKGEAGLPVLDFHHVDPSEKLFGLTKREAGSLKWDLVLTEMKKCVLLCCRCHREYHAGLLSKEVIDDLYKTCWTNRSRE